MVDYTKNIINRIIYYNAEKLIKVEFIQILTRNRHCRQGNLFYSQNVPLVLRVI